MAPLLEITVSPPRRTTTAPEVEHRPRCALGRTAVHACEDCGLPRLVAFTCAGRGFCPTCLGRRMNQTTQNLLAHVVPAQPLRQWVLSLPYALRAPLAYEPGLMSVVARVFEDSLLRWYERRLAPGDRAAQGGLLTVIQRSSGDMRLNPHLHVVALDGVYVADPTTGRSSERWVA